MPLESTKFSTCLLHLRFSRRWLWRALYSGMWHRAIWQLLLASSVLSLLFDPENGGSTVLRNVGNLIPNCKVSLPRRQYVLNYQQSVVTTERSHKLTTWKHLISQHLGSDGTLIQMPRSYCQRFYIEIWVTKWCRSFGVIGINSTVGLTVILITLWRIHVIVSSNICSSEMPVGLFLSRFYIEIVLPSCKGTSWFPSSLWLVFHQLSGYRYAVWRHC
jgi:hypothetical protein